MTIFLLKTHNSLKKKIRIFRKPIQSKNNNHNIYNFTNINKILPGKVHCSILSTHALRSDMKRNHQTSSRACFRFAHAWLATTEKKVVRAHARREARFFKPWGSEESARKFSTLIVLRARKGRTLCISSA